MVFIVKAKYKKDNDKNARYYSVRGGVENNRQIIKFKNKEKAESYASQLTGFNTRIEKAPTRRRRSSNDGYGGYGGFF